MLRLRCELASMVLTVAPTCWPVVEVTNPPPPRTFCVLPPTTATALPPRTADIALLSSSSAMGRSLIMRFECMINSLERRLVWSPRRGWHASCLDNQLVAAEILDRRDAQIEMRAGIDRVDGRPDLQ